MSIASSFDILWIIVWIFYQFFNSIKQNFWECHAINNYENIRSIFFIFKCIIERWIVLFSFLYLLWLSTWGKKCLILFLHKTNVRRKSEKIARHSILILPARIWMFWKEISVHKRKCNTHIWMINDNDWLEK